MDKKLSGTTKRKDSSSTSESQFDSSGPSRNPKKSKPEALRNDVSSTSTVDETTLNTTPSVKLLKDRRPSLDRLNELAKHRRSSKSRNNSQISQDGKELSMAVRLPRGATSNSLAVTVELEPLKRGAGSNLMSNNDTLLLQCTEETESRTVYTGVMRVPTNTDISKLAAMPLYILDSHEQLLLNPTTKLSHRVIIKQSEDTFSEDETGQLAEDVKIKLQLEKLPKTKASEKQNRKLSNAYRSAEREESMQMQRKDIEMTNMLSRPIVCAVPKSESGTRLQNLFHDSPSTNVEKVKKSIDSSTSYDLSEKERLTHSEIKNAVREPLNCAVLGQKNINAEHFDDSLRQSLPEIEIMTPQSENSDRKRSTKLDIKTPARETAYFASEIRENNAIDDGLRPSMTMRPNVLTAKSENTDRRRSTRAEINDDVYETASQLRDNSSITEKRESEIMAPKPENSDRKRSIRSESKDDVSQIYDTSKQFEDPLRQTMRENIKTLPEPENLDRRRSTKSFELTNEYSEKFEDSPQQLKRETEIVAPNPENNNRRRSTRSENKHDLHETARETRDKKMSPGTSEESLRQSLLSSRKNSYRAKRKQSEERKGQVNTIKMLSEGLHHQTSLIVENPPEWMYVTYEETAPTSKTRNKSTQYSNTNFIANKEVDVQVSLMLQPVQNYGFFGYSSEQSTAVSSQLFLAQTPYIKANQVISQTSNGDRSSDITNLPKSTTSTNTECSTTLLSQVSDYNQYYTSTNAELKVPSNSPNSCTNLQHRLCDSQNQTDATTTPPNNKKSEKSHIPGTYWNSNEPSRNKSRTDQDEQYGTTGKKDKTLELLEGARLKLITYLGNEERSKKTKKWFDDDLIDLCAVLPTNHDLNPFGTGGTMEMANLDVNALKGAKKKNAEIHKRCYEDNDEYYERQRRDVRRYFEVENHNQEAKKSFDYYLNGDNMEKDVCPGNSIFQVYPLIIDPPQVKSLKTQATAKLCEIKIENGDEPSTSSNELEKEFGSLQQIYDDMCTSMQFILELPDNPIKTPLKQSGEIQKIGDDLTNTLSELNVCLSTITEILSESSSSLIVDATNQPPAHYTLPNLVLDSSKSSEIVFDLINKQHEESNASEEETNKIYIFDLISDCLNKTRENKSKTELSREREETYTSMEHDINLTIQELLKESKDIKEAVILNGGKEEVEPPFSFEFIDALLESDPLKICKTIFEDILNASMEVLNKNEENKLQDDVNYIIDVLLDEVDRENFLDETFRSKENFLFDTAYKKPGGNLQQGDSTAQEVGSTIEKTFFCTMTTSRIPKTSFSFGETPTTYLEVQNSNFKTPVRRRDGLTITGEENLKKTSDTSRLMNEILNLQPKEEFSINRFVPEDDDLSKVNEQFATVSHLLVNSPEESPKPANSSLLNNQKNDVANEESNNNEENSDSNDVPPPPPSPPNNDNDKTQPSTHSANVTIPKSKKHFQLPQPTNKSVSKNQPSTSITTEEEEQIENIDLTQRTRSSSEPEYFLPVPSSHLSQKVSNFSRAQTSRVSDSSSEEVIVAKPKPTKKKHAPPVVEIMPKISLISDSDSGNIPQMQRKTIYSDQDLMSQYSYIVLRPAAAISNIQVLKNRDPSMTGERRENLSTDNRPEISETEYEGDIETLQMRLPNPKHRFKSQQELNTLDEVAKIEQNVKENDRLLKPSHVLLKKSDTSFEYDDSNSENWDSNTEGG